jgi:hypothetical protein
VILHFVDKLLYLVDVVRNKFVTDKLASVLGDKDVVFDTNATEILVGFEKVIIDEILMQALLAPVVDKSRDEVNTRFVCHYPTFL